MDGMNKLTDLDDPVWGFSDDSEGTWVSEAGRRRVVGLQCGGGGLLLLGRKRVVLGPVLRASAIIRRAPKCASHMYVWSSADLRLIYA